MVRSAAVRRTPRPITSSEADASARRCRGPRPKTSSQSSPTSTAALQVDASGAGGRRLRRVACRADAGGRSSRPGRRRAGSAARQRRRRRPTSRSPARPDRGNNDRCARSHRCPGCSPVQAMAWLRSMRTRVPRPAQSPAGSSGDRRTATVSGADADQCHRTWRGRPRYRSVSAAGSPRRPVELPSRRTGPSSRADRRHRLRRETLTRGRRTGGAAECSSVTPSVPRSSAQAGPQPTAHAVTVVRTANAATRRLPRGLSDPARSPTELRPLRPASPASATPRCPGCRAPRPSCPPSPAAGGSGRRSRPW